MSPPSNPLPIYSWPPPSSSNPSNVQNNSTIPSKFPLLGQQKQFINGYSSPSNLATTNCMSPLAALQQQFEQKQRGPWHRRLSPLKKKTSSSSFSSARPLATSSSISPQRRPPSPEKRQRPVPIYQQMNGAKNGGGTFQEAWEHLSRQCAASISEQSRLPLHVHSMPPSPTKSSSGQMPLPNSPPSTSNSSPLEMPDSINPIGRALPTALSNDGQKNGTMTESTTLALAPSSSCETMSSSILASPAWYRDRDGRTGYRPDDFPHGARVQNSPIKVIPTAFKKNGIDENKSTKQQIASSTLQRPPNPPIIRQEQRHNQSVEASPIRPIRHSSTLPLPSSSNKQKHISPSFHHFHGLPPIGPNNGNGAPPFPLRRTQHAINVNSGMANSERAKHDWFIRNGTNDGAQKGEEMAQLMKTSIQSQQSMASTTTQKVVKFAETVQINEIAPRGELESSLCSSTSSSSNSSSCPSSASNSSSSDEEDRQNRPKTNGNSSMNFAGRNQEISLPKRTVTSPPLAVVRPRTTTKISMEMKNGIEGYTENGQQKGIIAENGHRKLQNVHPETAELERVIEQFFQHCQSLSSLNPAANAEQNQQTQNQSQSQPNLLISPQSPIQQRSVYDNLGDEEGANADWLHTKAKVIGQQNLGPSIGIWARDGSPKRRVEVTVTTSTTTSNPTTNSGTNNNNNGRSMAIIGGSAPYSVQTLPLTNLPLANRKSNSMDPPISRIPLARPSATIRPTGGGGHHSGSESSSSCSSSSTGQLIKGRPRLGSNPTMSNQKHSFAVLKKRRMKP